MSSTVCLTPSGPSKIYHKKTIQPSARLVSFVHRSLAAYENITVRREYCYDTGSLKTATGGVVSCAMSGQVVQLIYDRQNASCCCSSAGLKLTVHRLFCHCARCHQLCCLFCTLPSDCSQLQRLHLQMYLNVDVYYCMHVSCLNYFIYYCTLYYGWPP